MPSDYRITLPREFLETEDEAAMEKLLPRGVGTEERLTLAASALRTLSIVSLIDPNAVDDLVNANVRFQRNWIFYAVLGHDLNVVFFLIFG